MLKKERNREHPHDLQISDSAKLNTRWNFFTVEKFPLCEDDQCNFGPTPIKLPHSGKWPLRGGWPLKRGKNNRKTPIGTLITGHLLDVVVQ